MFQGSWTCSKCGGEIKELPFEPRSTSGLTCRDCYFNTKNGNQSGGSQSATLADDTVDTGAGSDIDDREIPPFDPDAANVASEPAPTDPEMASAPAATGRQMFTGDWKCASCGAAITSLPFQPRAIDGLKCLDCFKNSKG